MAINDACLCGQGMNNVGIPNCVKMFEKTTMLYLVPLYDNSGVRNSLLLTVDGLSIEAATKNPDPSQRWYPITDLKDVELPTAESRFETAKDGSKFKLANGIKSFKATKFESGSMFTAKLQGVSCSEFGVVLGDIDGNARGVKDGNNFYPIKIGGWDAIFMDATDDNVNKTMIQFDFDILLKISRYWILSADDLGQNPNDSTGVIDANIAISDITDVTFTATVTSDYGYGSLFNNTPGLITGIPDAAFVLTNETDSTTLAPTITETSDGVYVFVFPAQTLADELSLVINPSINSDYESTAVTITVAC